MLRQLTPDAWARRGVANGNPFSVRALAHALLGHERAHLQILSERYAPYQTSRRRTSLDRKSIRLTITTMAITPMTIWL